MIDLLRNLIHPKHFLNNTTEWMSSNFPKKIFLQLQIKRVVWVLKDLWHRFKRDAIITKVGNSTHFRHLQFYRYKLAFVVLILPACLQEAEYTIYPKCDLSCEEIYRLLLVAFWIKEIKLYLFCLSAVVLFCNVYCLFSFIYGRQWKNCML